MLTSWWLHALMNELKILAGLLNVLLLGAGNLLFKDHYCIFPTVNIIQTMLSCSKSNSQMMKRLFQSRTTEGKRRRIKNRKNLTANSLSMSLSLRYEHPCTRTLFLFLTLSICQRRYKTPLSWKLSRDYPSVPQEVGRAPRCHITNVVKVIVHLLGLRLLTRNRATNKQTQIIYPLNNLFLFLAHLRDLSQTREHILSFFHH